MLSLSTAYHITKFPHWKTLLAETKKLGFNCLELSVEVPEDMLREAEVSVENKEIIISSLHNYCPKLENLPSGRSIFSGYIINSDDDDERKLAVEFTKRTIEWAARLRAKAVVMHLGEVNTGSAGQELANYTRHFGRKGMLYVKYWDALVTARAQKSELYLEKLMKSLDELLPYASDKKITLGFENRFYYHEIPNLEELSRLFEKFSGAPVGYWHDTGHAEMFVRQGWVKEHTDLLKPFKGKIVGLHLHDVRGLHDHFAPGSGEFDFRVLQPYISNEPLKIVEAHSKCSPAEVHASVSYLAKCGI